MSLICTTRHVDVVLRCFAQRVSLQSTAGEYIKIKELFNRTMRGFSILNIDRIQNKALWEVFQW